MLSDKAASEGPSSRAVWQGREHQGPNVSQLWGRCQGHLPFLPGRKWDKVPRAHVTQGRQARSSIKLPGDRDVAENSKIKEMTLKTKRQGFTCSWGWPPGSTVTQLPGWDTPATNSLPWLGRNVKWRV